MGRPWGNSSPRLTITEYSPMPRKLQLPILITTCVPSGLVPVDKGSLNIAVSESSPVALSGPGRHPLHKSQQAQSLTAYDSWRRVEKEKPYELLRNELKSTG